jgi:hypothetical protein
MSHMPANLVLQAQGLSVASSAVAWFTISNAVREVIPQP